MASTRSTRGIVWVKTPEELAKAYDAFGKKILVAVHAAGARVGTAMQNAARKNAGWEDRTGNARGGLFFVVDGFGAQQKVGEIRQGKGPDAQEGYRENLKLEKVEGGNAVTLVVFLGHAMRYGVSLETEHGQRYAIIWPTITGVGIPEMERLLGKLFEGL
jgi:hypothetical protein